MRDLSEPVMPSDHCNTPVAKAASADRGDERAPIQGVVAQAVALAKETEAQAAESVAIAAADRARVRAARLRRQAEAMRSEAAVGGASVDGSAGTDATETNADTASVSITARAGRKLLFPPRISLPRLRRPSWITVVATAALLCACALMVASGYMAWQHRQAVQQQQRVAEFAAAARQIVVSLMSIDHNHANEDVQRILDNSTGQFRKDFQDAAEDFVKIAQDSKATTVVDVQFTAVESMTDDQAEVLVAATSKVTNAAGAKEDPRSWRLVVDVERDSDRIKLVNVEFVP